MGKRNNTLGNRRNRKRGAMKQPLFSQISRRKEKKPEKRTSRRGENKKKKKKTREEDLAAYALLLREEGIFRRKTRGGKKKKSGIKEGEGVLAGKKNCRKRENQQRSLIDRVREPKKGGRKTRGKRVSKTCHGKKRKATEIVGATGRQKN